MDTEEKNIEVFAVGVHLPELGLIPAEFHGWSERAQIKSGLNHSQWCLFVVDGLLESFNVPLLTPNLLQYLQEQ